MSTSYTHRLRTNAEILGDLQRHLHFSNEDLEENRQGALSAAQKKFIFHDSVISKLHWSALSLLGAVIARYLVHLLAGETPLEAILAIWSSPVGVEDMFGMWEGPLSIAGVARVAPAAFMLLAVSLIPWRLILDIVYGDVESSTGKADVIMRGVNDHVSLQDRQEEWRSTLDSGEEPALGAGRQFEDWEDRQQVYHLRINGMQFPVSKRLTRIIEEGSRYAVHYTDWSKRIVAIEPKKQDWNSPQR